MMMMPGAWCSDSQERRLNLWRQGDLDLLLKEVRFIQGN